MDEKYKGYRIPKALIGYAVRLYFRYKLSLRDVSELLMERGLTVTYESIRLWPIAYVRFFFGQHLKKIYNLIS